jgi:hypothetical protein
VVIYVCVAVAAAMAWQGGLAANRESADPEERTFADGVYANPYFGLRYPLPPGWKEGLLPPRPSYTGYYVLITPAPPENAKATILIAAQDEFFASKPIMDARALLHDLARNLSAADHTAAPITVTTAAHRFLRLEIQGTPLSRIVLATEIRCHVVIFTFTGAQPEQLKGLAASLENLSFAPDSGAPVCIKGYATAQTIRRRVEPIPAGPRFVRIAVRIIIGPDGKVGHVHVIRAFPEQQKNIEDALRKWRFEPYLTGGRPAAIETGLTFEFRPASRGD